MRIVREARFGLGRVDYVYEFSVGVEVKSAFEVIHYSGRVIRQLGGYLRDGGLDYLILLVRDNPGSVDTIKSLSTGISRVLPCRVAVAIGDEHDPLTWRAVTNSDVVSVVKKRAGGWCWDV